MKKVQYFITCLIAIMIYTTANAEGTKGLKGLKGIDKEPQSLDEYREQLIRTAKQHSYDPTKPNAYARSHIQTYNNTPLIQSAYIEGVGQSNEVKKAKQSLEEYRQSKLNNIIPIDYKPTRDYYKQSKWEQALSTPVEQFYFIEGLGKSKFDDRITSLGDVSNLQDFRAEQRASRNSIILIISLLVALIVAVWIGVTSCSPKKSSKEFIDMSNINKHEKEDKH